MLFTGGGFLKVRAYPQARVPESTMLFTEEGVSVHSRAPISPQAAEERRPGLSPHRNKPDIPASYRYWPEL